MDATVLYDDRATTVTVAVHDPNDASALWIRTGDLPRINGFDVKAGAACRADICIPLDTGIVRGNAVNLTAFAQRIGEAVVADTDARVWSFGEIPALDGSDPTRTDPAWRTAPDVAVADRRGRTIRVSDFRGKKVLLVTWASW